jgi:hypothetical protein
MILIKYFLQKARQKQKYFPIGSVCANEIKKLPMKTTLNRAHAID